MTEKEQALRRDYEAVTAAWAVLKAYNDIQGRDIDEYWHSLIIDASDLRDYGILGAQLCNAIINTFEKRDHVRKIRQRWGNGSTESKHDPDD